MDPKNDLLFDELVGDLERRDFDHDGFRETLGSFDCDLSLLLRKRPRTLGMVRFAGGGEEGPPDDASDDRLDIELCELHMKLGESNMKGMRSGLEATQKMKISEDVAGEGRCEPLCVICIRWNGKSKHGKVAKRFM